MRTRAHQRTGTQQQLWSNRIWPPLAGAVTAVGVIAASNLLGVLATGAAYVTLALFAVTVVWGLSLEIGLDRTAVVRCGLLSALAVVVALGLAEIHPQYGPIVGLSVVLTSPSSLGLVAKARARTKTPAEPTAPRTPGVLLDKAMLDRRFNEIVNQLREPGGR